MLMTREGTCDAVLVVHTDGTRECDHEHGCGADPLVHEWWLPCEELGCGCGEGEAAPEPVWLPLAA